MTAHAIPMPQRRGACPGLSAPMPTGDGLLVRLLPIGTIPLASFADLCAAARTYGNGVIEITSRGSIQVRGLSAGSAPSFAAAVAALGIAAQDGIPVHCNALSGLDAEDLLDAGVIAADLRAALLQRSMAARLGAKICVAIDGGGPLNLARLAADIRVHAQATSDDIVLRVGIGGDDTNATDLGVVARAQGVETIMRLLDVLASRPYDTRARDVLTAEGDGAFRAAIVDLLTSARPRASGDPALDSRLRGNERKFAYQSGQPIGVHRLRDESLACGIGLGFGHADADTLERLVEAAAALGANGLRTAPDRALMTIGLRPDTVSDFAAAADRLGFIVQPGDPRRHVVACAGAPICASAHIAARAIAPLIAERIAPHRDSAFTVHVSGCAKGCAYAAAAALTVVGTPDGGALVANGTARDAPFTVVAVDQLPAAIANYARDQKNEMANV
jgi:precorrin-3B synthase